jgi:hypothetical protein
MGDGRRFQEFAMFIDRTFPAANRVMDVAGGHGDLAFWLHRLGKRPVVVDPRESRFSGRIRRALRKEAMRTGRLVQIERRCARVEDIDLREFDLIAALHPDEATEPAVRSAIAHGIDFAVVPCCVFPLDGVKRSQAEWLRYLASLAPGIAMTSLPIVGANVVLWKRSHGSGPADRRR